MNISNVSLPTGKKFYPLSETTQIIFSHILHRPVIDAINKAKEAIPSDPYLGNFWSMYSRTLQYKRLSEEVDYPIYELPQYVLCNADNRLRDMIATKKTYYASQKRVGQIGIPINKDGKLKLQYDPIRKGLIVHDHPYEGELLGNKPMVVNKNLKELIRVKLEEIEVLALISEDDGLMPIDHVGYYTTKTGKGEIIADTLPKLFDGTYTETDVVTLSYIMGRYPLVYKNSTMCIDTTKPTGRMDDFNFSAGLRTRLTYHFGGYTLPNNYEEWFDG